MKFTKLAMVGFVSATLAQVSYADQYQETQVKVERVTEITKPYTETIQSGESCYNTTVEVDVRCGGNVDTNSIGVDTIIGAVIGGAVGNQIGQGNGRTAARIIGGLGGGVVANNMRDNRVCKSYETVKKCNPEYRYNTVYKTIGYNNCATIDGVEYCKQTSQPVQYLNVKRTIQVW